MISNKDIEHQVLGGVLSDDRRMKTIIDDITYEDFYEDINQKIYTAMSYLYHNNEKINYNTVLDRLEFKKVDIDVEYLLDLPDSIIRDDERTFDANVESLKSLSYKRKLYYLGKYLTEEQIDGISDENLTRKIKGVIDESTTKSNIEIIKLGDYAKGWLENYDKPLDPSDKFLFGYKLLDDLVMLRKTNFMIVGARPSVGKSAWALEFSKHIAMQDKKTLFITLEMSDKEVMDRLIANISGVESEKLKRRKTLTPDERQRVKDALTTIEKLPLNIFYSGTLKTTHLYNLCKKLHKEGNLDILIVDYLQLLSSDNKNNRNNEVSEISRMLKIIAQELNIPVVALSQLSRDSEEKKKGSARPPQLSDLRDSGSLEQDANIVMFLHTEDVNNKFQKRKFLECLIRKNRDGSLGKIPLEFEGDFLRFYEKEYNPDTKTFERVEKKDFKDDDIIHDDDLPF